MMRRGVSCWNGIRCDRAGDVLFSHDMVFGALQNKSQSTYRANNISLMNTA